MLIKNLKILRYWFLHIVIQAIWISCLSFLLIKLISIFSTLNNYQNDDNFSYYYLLILGMIISFISDYAWAIFLFLNCLFINLSWEVKKSIDDYIHNNKLVIALTITLVIVNIIFTTFNGFIIYSISSFNI